MSENIIIAIDGPAGSGKSTTARLVAQKLGYVYIDTGAMYRGVTWLAISSGLLDNDEALVELLSRKHITLVPGAEDNTVLLDEEDITSHLRSPEVNANVSPVSKIPAVREELIRMQRKMGEKGGVVMEGRDIGSVVFPNAHLKIFLTATLHERVKRRVNEFSAKGKNVTTEEVMHNLSTRDHIDSTRDVAPLVCPDGAVTVDTSYLSIDEQVTLIVEKAREVMASDT